MIDAVADVAWAYRADWRRFYRSELDDEPEESFRQYAIRLGSYQGAVTHLIESRSEKHRHERAKAEADAGGKPAPVLTPNKYDETPEQARARRRAAMTSG